MGGDDALIDAAQRKEIGSALDRAGIDHELVVYPGVEHAFFWPGTRAYDADATEDAWQRILDLIGQEPAG